MLYYLHFAMNVYFFKTNNISLETEIVLPRLEPSRSSKSGREWFEATMQFSEKTAVQREILAARTALRLSSSSTAESCEKGRTCVQTGTSEGRTAAKVSECHPRSSIQLAGTACARALLLGKLEAQEAGRGRSHSQTS